MPMEMCDYSKEKYFAFISYCTKDNTEAKRLHHKLEYFKITSAQALKKGLKRKPLNPTFFAPYEIQPNGLTEELKARLRNSKFLIVVCSPNSAQSQWVQWEINYFVSLGRKDRIYFFIVDGIPNSGDLATECYGPAIKQNGLSGILGANIHEKVFKISYLNRERAYIQLITKLLDIEFDAVWQRHKRHIKIKIFSIIFLTILVLCSIMGAIYFSSAYDSKISFTKASAPSLYEGEGIFQVILDNDTITQQIDDTDHPCIVKNIPGKYRYKKVRCKFYMFGYEDVDTILLLSDREISFEIQRIHDIYGHIEGEIVKKGADFTPIVGAIVRVGQLSASTNEDGFFTMDIPLESQNSNCYNATIEYENLKKHIVLYPMRRNSNIKNLLVFE